MMNQMMPSLNLSQSESLALSQSESLALSPAEFVFVLMLDMVGYSVMSHEDQALRVAALTECVRATETFQTAVASGEALAFSSGDGIGLAFPRTPHTAAQCALEIARAIQNYPGLELRMGLHCGLVSRHTDITGNTNLTGNGVNMAARVMNCGDAGHILLSREFHYHLKGLEAWQGYLHPLGERVVKHEEVISLYALCKDGLGHRTPPQKWRGARPHRAAARAKAAVRRRVQRHFLPVWQATALFFRTGKLRPETNLDFVGF